MPDKQFTARLIKEVVFTKDIEALKQAAPVRKAFYKDDEYPASTWVQIDRLFVEEFLIEVDVIAVITE